MNSSAKHDHHTLPIRNILLGGFLGALMVLPTGPAFSDTVKISGSVQSRSFIREDGRTLGKTGPVTRPGVIRGPRTVATRKNLK
jgi:hypothetical protein